MSKSKGETMSTAGALLVVLCGPQGCGKSTVAPLIAKATACERMYDDEPEGDISVIRRELACGRRVLVCTNDPDFPAAVSAPVLRISLEGDRPTDALRSVLAAFGQPADAYPQGSETRRLGVAQAVPVDWCEPVSGAPVDAPFFGDIYPHRYACMKKRRDLARADELLAKAKQLDARVSAISALEAISLRAQAQMLRVQSRCACLPSQENADPRGSCCEPAKVSSDA